VPEVGKIKLDATAHSIAHHSAGVLFSNWWHGYPGTVSGMSLRDETPITQYTWKVGGRTKTGEEVTFDVSPTKKYDVTLTVKDAVGSDSVTKTVDARQVKLHMEKKGKGQVLVDGDPIFDPTSESDSEWIKVKYGKHKLNPHGFVRVHWNRPNERLTEFDFWSNGRGKKLGSKDPWTLDIRGHRTLVAHFKKVNPTLKYPLSVTINPTEGGSVKVVNTGNTYDKDFSKEFVEGKEVTLYAEPASGYAFDGWSGDRMKESRRMTVTMDDSNEVTANFVKKGQPEPTYYNLSFSSTEGGHVETDMHGEGKYKAGTEVFVYGVAASGYQFDHWSGDRSGTTKGIFVQMNSDKHLKAHFVKNPKYYQLNLNTDPGDGGVISLEPHRRRYRAGTKVKLTAEPSSGYRFDRWTGDASGTSRTITVTMNQDKSITAEFSSVTNREVTISVSVGKGNGKVLMNGKETNELTVNRGEEVTLKAKPASGWAFDSWAGDVSATSNPVVVTVDKDMDVIANFARAEVTLTLKTDPAKGGEVTSHMKAQAVTSTYPVNSEVIVEAHPNEGYFFKSWSGPLEDEGERGNKTISVLMDTDKTLVANFGEKGPSVWQRLPMTAIGMLMSAIGAIGAVATKAGVLAKL